jgi:hypothetical protein
MHVAAGEMPSMLTSNVRKRAANQHCTLSSAPPEWTSIGF